MTDLALSELFQAHTWGEFIFEAASWTHDDKLIGGYIPSDPDQTLAALRHLRRVAYDDTCDVCIQLLGIPIPATTPLSRVTAGGDPLLSVMFAFPDDAPEGRERRIRCRRAIRALLHHREALAVVN